MKLDIKDYGYVICPEYAGNICHTLKQKDEELKALRVELEKNSKELEVYKKALELACSADGMFWESEYNDYLKKVRGKNYG